MNHAWKIFKYNFILRDLSCFSLSRRQWICSQQLVWFWDVSDCWASAGLYGLRLMYNHSLLGVPANHIKRISNAYQGDLRKIPGPWLSRFFRLPLKLAIMSGDRYRYIHSLHEKYGSYKFLTFDLWSWTFLNTGMDHVGSSLTGLYVDSRSQWVSVSTQAG